MCGTSKLLHAFGTRILHCPLMRLCERCMQFIEFITEERASGKNENGVHMYLCTYTRRCMRASWDYESFVKKWNDFMIFRCVRYTSREVGVNVRDIKLLH